MAENKKVALTHDFLVQYGGAERVLEVLCEIFPDAPIYTLLYDQEKMGKRFEGRDIRTSFIQKFPRFLKKRYRWLLPFFMVAPETIDLREYDLVISSSGAWMKGIITRLNTIHVSYLHSPMRFAWEEGEKYFSQFSIFNFRFSKFFIRLLFSYIRMWDSVAAKRPDYLIANSKYTQQRIQKYYHRESTVIYPPAFDESKIKNYESRSPRENGEYFLIVSRLSPYKKVEVAIEAFNKLGLPLVVIGDGKQRKHLAKIAKEHIALKGFVDDTELRKYYENARAFIFPADDDFGMTMVEAMSHGVPVIAYKKGGAKEVIKERENGLFFEAQTPEILADGVRRFMDTEKEFDAETIRRSVEKFSKERFKGELMGFINKIL